MHRVRLFSVALVVCSLGVYSRAHAQQPATPPDGWVVLGVDEYRALRERASPQPPRPDPPPVEATLTRIDYDLRVDGQPVPMRSGDRPAILISRPGRSVVTLDISLPLTAAAGGESIQLPPSAASISRATLTLPRTGIDVTVAGGFLADRTETP